MFDKRHFKNDEIKYSSGEILLNRASETYRHLVLDSGQLFLKNMKVIYKIAFKKRFSVSIS